MTNEEYLEASGLECPFCKSQDVKDTFPCLRQEDFTITIQVKCCDCLKRWHEMYTLIGYYEITP